MHKRIVVTGLGVISPLGNNVSDFWNNLKSSKNGIKKINHFDVSNFDIKVAGFISDFNLNEFVKTKLSLKFDNFIQYGLAAGIQAIQDSNIIFNKKINKNDIGVVMGSGICGLNSIENNYRSFLQEGYKGVRSNLITNCIINTTGGYLSILHGFTGPNISVSTACATGGHSICLAEQLIRQDRAKIVIAGSSEYATTPFVISGFLALKTLSKNSNPETASRPWDLKRDGFVVSDGAACIVLEEYEHAINRDCNIYAELIGTSFNSDSYHIVRANPSGDGIYSCMKNVIDSYGLKISDIDYINAHATSTLRGDLSEGNAISRLLFNNNKNIPVSSTKSLTGHLLGASGSLEALITILCLKNQFIISNHNLENEDKSFSKLNLIKKNIKSNLKYVISNSLGFGGVNSVVLFKKL